tara:strand:+ start:15837 stop:16268 length:432 start_codon:yes stop_codon:yes gene_type:complete
MAENVNLNKEVFNKRDYTKTISTTFTQLDVKTVQEQIDEQPTVQEFFNLYNELFYEINELGETNSHEYLIKTSSQYIDFSKNDELIEALQREISQLREELLETQQQLAGDTTPTPILTNNTTSVSSGTSGTSGGSGGSGGGGY